VSRTEVAADDPGFLAEVERAIPGSSRLASCIQCGTCGGSCPSSADMDHTPRQLFALVRANVAHGGEAKIVPIDGILPGAPGYALRR